MILFYRSLTALLYPFLIALIFVRRLINKEDERSLMLSNGKIVNVNDGKITSFDFKNTRLRKMQIR